MKLEIKIINNLNELTENIKEWKALFDSIPTSDFYLHPYWHLSWWKAIGKKKKMHIIYISAEGKIVGVLPLAFYRGELNEAKLRMLGFSGGSQTDRNNYLLHPDYKSEGIQIFQKEFNKLLTRVDVACLYSIPLHSELIDQHFLNDKKVHAIRNSSPYINIANLSYEQLQKSWSTSHRGDIRRQSKRLESLGELSLKVYSNNDDINHLLKDFLESHTLRWNYKFDEKYKKMQNFYRELIIAFNNEHQGAIHFSSLLLNNKPISYHFGFLYKHRFLYYKPTYNLEYQNYSPGKVHIAKLIELGIQSEWEIFDFLLGDENYKHSWMNGTDYSNTYYIKGGGLLGKLGMWWFTEGADKVRKLIKTSKTISKLKINA